MLIAISLGVMIMLSLFCVIAGAGWDTLGMSSAIEGTDGLVTEGGFSIDSLTGAIGIILIVMMIAVIFGLRFWSSGLSESSIRTITIGLSYGSLWVLFSIFAEPLLAAIEIFGMFLYITLTIAYVIGVIQKISGGSI